MYDFDEKESSENFVSTVCIGYSSIGRVDIKSSLDDTRSAMSNVKFVTISYSSANIPSAGPLGLLLEETDGGFVVPSAGKKYLTPIPLV